MDKKREDTIRKIKKLMAIANDPEIKRGKKTKEIIRGGQRMTYYVIAYDEGIYAGTYSNEDGNYIYSSNSINRKKPKVFKTKNGAIVHLENLRNKIVYGHDINEYHFHILEWTEDELSEHLKIAVKEYTPDDRV